MNLAAPFSMEMWDRTEPSLRPAQPTVIRARARMSGTMARLRVLVWQLVHHSKNLGLWLGFGFWCGSSSTILRTWDYG